MYIESEVSSTEGSGTDSFTIPKAGSSNAAKDSGSLGNVGTDQFFSPTTKKVLEEIHNDPAKKSPAVESASVKRPLAFTSAATQPWPTTSSNEIHATIIAEQVVDITAGSDEQMTEPLLANIDVTKMKNKSASKNQSPVKKLKNKED